MVFSPWYCNLLPAIRHIFHETIAFSRRGVHEEAHGQRVRHGQSCSLAPDGDASRSLPLHVWADGPFRKKRPAFQSYEELGGEPPYPALGLLAPNTWEEAFVTQTKTIYDRIATLLGDQASTLQDIVFHSVYLRDMRNFPVLARTRSHLFAGGLAPPVTTSQVAGLPLADAVVYFRSDRLCRSG